MENKNLERKIRERIKEARKLDIPHKIAFVSYVSGELRHRCFDYDHYAHTESGLTLLTKIYYHPTVRFIIHKDTKAIYRSDWEAFSETNSNITGYFPGEWLEILDLLYEKAQKHRRNKPDRFEGILCHRDEETLRKRFGL